MRRALRRPISRHAITALAPATNWKAVATSVGASVLGGSKPSAQTQPLKAIPRLAAGKLRFHSDSSRRGVRGSHAQRSVVVAGKFISNVERHRDGGGHCALPRV